MTGEEVQARAAMLLADIDAMLSDRDALGVMRRVEAIARDYRAVEMLALIITLRGAARGC